MIINCCTALDLTAQLCTVLYSSGLHWHELNKTAMHFPVLKFTALNWTEVQCTALKCTAVHWSALQCTEVHCNALQCSALQCSSLQCSALHWSAKNAQHCTTLICKKCTALHCTALHFTVHWFCTWQKRLPDNPESVASCGPEHFLDQKWSSHLWTYSNCCQVCSVQVDHSIFFCVERSKQKRVDIIHNFLVMFISSNWNCS